MKTITVKNLDGTNENVEIVYYFDIKDLNKTFAIISKNEKLKEGMSKVYISEVTEEVPGMFKFIAITDESVWDSVKGAMKAIIQGNKLESSKNISGVVELLGSRVIGIKDTDKEKFASISLESSFTIETPAQPEVQVSVQPEVQPEVGAEPEVSVQPEVQTEMPTTTLTTEEVKPEVSEEETPSTNIFDQIAQASPVDPVSTESVLPETSEEEPIVQTNEVVQAPIKEESVVSQPVFDMPEVKETKEESNSTMLNTYFDLIKSEIAKKDKLIEEQKARIMELESELKAYKNTNVYEAPGQQLGL